jgi:hypothetical protein
MEIAKSFSIDQLTQIMVPFKDTVSLTVKFNMNRCNIAKSKIAEILGHMQKNKSDKIDKISPFLSYVCQHAKRTGSKRIDFTNRRESGAKGWGRLTPDFKKSAFRINYVKLPRAIRHYLAAGLYTDIDIDNCHPVLIEQLMQLWDPKKADLMKKWNSDRSNIFQTLTDHSALEVCTKDDCKRVGFTFLYDGDVDNAFNEIQVDKTDPNIAPIYKLCCDLKQAIISLSLRLKHDFPKVWEQIPVDPDKPSARIDVSKFSTLIQHIECHLALIMIKTAEDMGLQVGDIAHDGLFIADDKRIGDDLLKLMSQQIKLKTGLNVNLSIKQFSEPEWARLLPETQIDIKDPLQAAKILIGLYPDFKYCCGILYVFDGSTGMWSSEDSTLLKIATKYAEVLTNWVTFPNKFNDVKKMLETLDTVIDNNWVIRTGTSSLGYILFSDCIWNFSEGVRMSFDKNIVFHARISRKCPNETDALKKIKDEVFDLLFRDTLGEEVGRYMCHILALALAGVREKFIRFLIGMANNGKSILSKALHNALGQYFASFDASILMVSQESDPAKRNRPLYLMKYARILMSQELSECGKKADSNMIKSLSSGGDFMSGRTHGKEEQEFNPHGSLFAAMNDMISKFDKMDDALSNRMMVIPYKVQFYTEAQLSDEQLLADQAAGLLKKRADPELSKRLQTDEYADAIVLLLMEAYSWKLKVPKEVELAKLDWFEDSDKSDPMVAFGQSFEFTDDPKDFISSSDIGDWLSKQDFGMTQQKFIVNSLKRHISMLGLSNVIASRKRHNGLQRSGWAGIRPLLAEPDACEL